MSQLDDVLNQATNDEVEVDFSGGIDFDPIPTDDYVCVIESVESGISKGSEKNPPQPKLVWKFKVVEGPHTDRVLFGHYPKQGKSSTRNKQVLAALGINVDDPTVRFRLSSVAGKKVVLAVGRQKDNDDFNEIKRVKAFVSSSPVPGL